MKRARVAYGGAVHDAFPLGHDDDLLRLADGRTVRAAEVVWLPPFEVGTIVALGLNYADHAKELNFSAEEEPLAFLKTSSSVVGHRAVTRRPRDATFMHYECELAVIIGRSAAQVPRRQAMEHVAGYTVANDYAVRDYLENWYRPNLRVKNRDTCTVLGPWWVDAADVPDPQNLALQTHVNGALVQDGNTRDMVHGIPALIEYLSGFMTLQAGDVILTGTPHGVSDVRPGDLVVTTIEGVGRLENTIADDSSFGR